MPKSVIVSGTLSEPSKLEVVLQYVEGSLRAAGHEVEWIRVRRLPPQSLLSGEAVSEKLLDGQTRLAESDVVVVASPVYKASYTGLLKAYLDLLPQHILAGKVVLPVAMGGSLAHMLTIDYALRPVLSALGAEHVLRGVYVTDDAVEWRDGVGVIRDLDVLSELERTLNQLRETNVKGMGV
ncbi:MAG: NADPH-dependent FMN reductase [Alicyclobacillaceae bacterium]|nr:NADPH-dependent FMN reductase [Alicyclobacillaceae bacterium]